MYIATETFADLQDFTYKGAVKQFHFYNKGDVFPREGQTVSDERIKELSTAGNRMKRPLIRLVEDEKPKDDVAPETPKKQSQKPRTRAKRTSK